MENEGQKTKESQNHDYNALFQQELLQLSQKQGEKKHVPSPYREIYEKYLEKTILRNIEEYSSELSKNCISYSPGIFVEKYTLHIIGQTECSRIISLIVSLSYFTFEIVVLNVEGNSQSPFNLTFINKGSLGQIFLNRYNPDEQFITKSVPYQQKKSFNKFYEMITKNNLNNVIVQYCIYKLCSVLRIGPYVTNYYGFDLIIYNQRVEFAMEYCQHKNNMCNYSNSNQLKESIRLLHSLHIVHGDIKPDNIMWSPRFKKFVFIDYGFAYITNQCQFPGEMTYTSYFGSYNYSCEQMGKAFQTKNKAYVDLYYNDIYALKKTFQNQKTKIMKQTYNKIFNVDTDEKSTQHFKQKKQKQERAYINYLLNLKLKRHIFDINLQEVKKLCQSKIRIYEDKIAYISYLEHDTLELLRQIKSSKNTIKMINYLTQQFALSTNNINIKEIVLYHSKKIIKMGTQNNIGELFHNRIQQKQAQNQSQTYYDQVPSRLHIDYPYEYNYCQIVSFIKFVYKQDISFRANFIKSKIKYRLKNNVLVNKRVPVDKVKIFWMYFYRYVSNIYTTKKQILKLFQTAKLQLNISKQQWSFCEDKMHRIREFQVPMKAILISQAYKKKYNEEISSLAHSQKLHEYYTFYQQFLKNNNVLDKVSQVYQEIFMEISSQKNQQEDEKKHKKRLIQFQKQKTLSNLSKVEDRLKQYYKQNPQKQIKTLQLYLLSMQITKSEIKNPWSIQYQKRYKLIQKIQCYQVTSKCKLVHQTLYHQLLQIMITREHEQIMNRFFMYQNHMFNYCLQSEYLLVSYFYIYVFYEVKNLLALTDEIDLKKIQIVLADFEGHVRQFLEIYMSQKQRPEELFALLLLTVEYCQFYLTPQLLMSIKQVFIKQFSTLYFLKEKSLSQFQISVMLRMDLINSHQVQQQKLLNLSLIQLKKSKIDSHYQSFSNFDLSNQTSKLHAIIRQRTKKQEQSAYLLKQIRLKTQYKLISSSQQESMLKQYINYFQKFEEDYYPIQNTCKIRSLNEFSIGLYINIIYNNMFSLQSSNKDPHKAQKLTYYVDMVYQYLTSNIQFLNVSKHYVLLDVLTVYERFFGNDFQKIFSTILLFLNRVHKNEGKYYGIIELYGAMENLFMQPMQTEIACFYQLFVNKFEQLSKQYQMFFQTQYPDLLVYCELLFGLFHYMSPNQKSDPQIVQMVKYLMKKSSYLYRYCRSSFIKSRFRSKATLMMNKLYQLSLLQDPFQKRRARTLLSCLRLSQYPLKQKQLEQSLKKISKKMAKNPQKLTILNTYKKTKQKITKMNSNKNQQVLKKPTNIINYRIQNRFYELLNQNYIKLPKFVQLENQI